MRNVLQAGKSKGLLLSSIFLSGFFIVLSLQLQAQTPPAKEWDKTYGGSGTEKLVSQIQTPDGGYLLGGTSDSGISGNKTTAGKGGSDFWLVKIAANGSKQWEKTYGGSGNDVFSSIIKTTDGGYLLRGTSDSGISGDKSEANRGGQDYWIVKVDANGNKQWDKTFGGSLDDKLIVVLLTSDGGYLLGGTSASPISGNKTAPSKGSTDYWIVKTDAAGNKQWDKAYGGSNWEALGAIVPTSNGGYLLGGISTSGATGDKSVENHFDWEDPDIWLIKVTGTGEKLWDKTFGYDPSDSYFTEDRLNALFKTADGHYIIGNDQSYQSYPDYSIIKIDEEGNTVMAGWISGNRWGGFTNLLQTADGGFLLGERVPEDGYGFYRYKIVKLNSQTKPEWEKTFSAASYAGLIRVAGTKDGGYLLQGYADLGIGGDKTEPSRGGNDFWMVKTDANGNKQWDKTIGGTNNEYFNSILETLDGGYLLGGTSDAGIGGDKTETNNGEKDYWIVKLSPSATAPAPKIVSLTLINADTDKDIKTIANGEVIDYASLGTKNITIRANTSPVGSVVFTLDGRVGRTENITPYALGGDVYPSSPIDYYAYPLTLGKHTLKATPYSARSARGTAGEALTVSFTVVEGPTVLSFTLINADTDKDIREIKPGEVIDYSKLGTKNINIRANTYPATVGSVVFNLNGRVVRTENILPYALGGDNYPTISDYKAYSLATGSYTLKATPYSEKYAKGTTGTALAVSFSVTNGTAARLGQKATQAAISVHPNPFTDRVAIQAGEESGKVRIEVVDALGKLQHKAEIKLQSGKAEVVLPAGLPAGAYFMLVVAEGKDPQVVKLLKQ